jgi:hypothetical protein
LTSIVKNHQELLDIKDERIAQVESLSAKDKEVIKRLREMNTTKATQVTDLEKEVKLLGTVLPFANSPFP